VNLLLNLIFETMKKFKITITQGQVFTCIVEVPEDIVEDNIHDFLATHGLMWVTIDKHSDFESNVEIDPATPEDETQRSLEDFFVSYSEAPMEEVKAFFGTEEEPDECTCHNCNEPGQDGNYCSNCGEEMH
jgi:hypothetical protein